MNVQFANTRVFPHGIAPVGENQALKLIEVCGRTAYKSEDKITDDSALSFVSMLKKHRHLSVLEHSNIVFQIQPDRDTAAVSGQMDVEKLAERLTLALGVRNVFHRIHVFGHENKYLALSGNVRAWIESLEDFEKKDKKLGEFLSRHLSRFYPRLFAFDSNGGEDFGMAAEPIPTDRQIALLKAEPDCDLPVFVFRIVCDRGITHEIVRHRVLSFTQESTRYVNYKNKGMVLVLPEEIQSAYDPAEEELVGQDPMTLLWQERAELLFRWYQNDLARGLKPQIARDILPNLLKSDIFVSGRWSGWRHFIALRDSKQAHPRIRYIARQIRSCFESLGLGAD